MSTEELARRAVLRVLAANSELVKIRDDDPGDLNEDPTLFQVLAPPAVLKLSLADVGLTTQQQVEVFRAELRARLPLIDGELAMVAMNSGTNIGRLRDFVRAALDLKMGVV